MSRFASDARSFSFAALVALFSLCLAGCPNGAGITCPLGQAYCNGSCIFVGTDANNCGACGNVCPPTLACINGACGCPAGLMSCGGACVDITVDPQNCGACANVCGAERYCVGGNCLFACPRPLSLCQNNTLCVDTANDAKNCGSCGNVCPFARICCGGSCVSPDTAQHCGGCAACPRVGDFCFDMPGSGFMCSPG